MKLYPKSMSLCCRSPLYICLLQNSHYIENYFSTTTNEIFIPHSPHIPVCQIVNKCVLAKLALFFQTLHFHNGERYNERGSD